MGQYDRSSKSQSMRYSWVKTCVFEMGATNLCGPISKLFNLVAREGFPGFMDYQHYSNDCQIR